MLRFLTGHLMTGGLYFGPAGWIPDAWRNTLQAYAPLSLALPAGVTEISARREQPVAAGDVVYESPNGAQADVVAPCHGTLGELIDIDDAAGGVGRAIVLRAAPIPVAASGAAISEAAKASNVPELCRLLKRGGIGACSPLIPSLLAQLVDLEEKPAQTLVINLLPLTPESRLTWALMEFQTQRMAAGIKLLTAALGARRQILVMDKTDWLAYRPLRKELKGVRLRARYLLNQYPKGNPTVLVRSLLGRRLGVGQLPTRVGVVMVDAVTIWALGGIAQGAPAMVSRPVEIFEAAAQPRVVEAPLGTRLEELLQGQAVAFKDRQCVVNGMMTGVEVDAEAAVVQGITGLVSVRDIPAEEKPSPCFACGWCVDHCPTGLNPVELFQLARTRDGSQMPAAQESQHCIGCGLCSYVCPTRLPLMKEVLGLQGALGRTRQEEES